MKEARLILMVLLGFISGHHLAQTNVVLQMEQMLGDQPFAYGEISEAEIGYYFKVSRLQYYISEITLIHDGGQQTQVADLHFLIDPAKDSIFPLGNFPITDLEQIEFWIGVDSAHNHLDPALYPEGHPLALKEPSMHWGWAGGYRFIAFEGLAGVTPGYVAVNYEIHTIGDENYKKVLLNVDEFSAADSMIIPIRADYTKLLHKMDVSGGLSSHSSVGKSKQIALNIPSVFTADIVSSSHQLKSETRFFIAPNPAKDFFTITLPLSPTKPLTLTMTNLQGKIILNETIHTADQTIELTSELIPGIYFVMLSDGQRSFMTEKVVVR